MADVFVSYSGSDKARVAPLVAALEAEGWSVWWDHIIEHGFDSGLASEERLFVHLPFEHSEDRDDQALSCELIGRLGNDGWTEYALAHKAIIDRFGRFPHRNAVLGRTSTAEEIVRLAEPMGSF